MFAIASCALQVLSLHHSNTDGSMLQVFTAVHYRCSCYAVTVQLCTTGVIVTL